MLKNGNGISENRKLSVGRLMLSWEAISCANGACSRSRRQIAETIAS
jgi:hypothetical protein